MYEFRDVNEVSEVTVLPSEALQINGEYIEDIVTGYKTLYVKGREALSPEINSYETGIRDGSVIKNRRFPARTITVGYQLITDTNGAFREAYNKLAEVLNVDNAELIFNDEIDKFYIGTPIEFSEVDAGKNAVTGEIEIFCADPFKYSVVEYEAIPDMIEGNILLDYEGTYKAYPVLQADFRKENETEGETVTKLDGKGECGYVAFFNEKEKIIQIGDPEETDEVVAYPKSQTLVSSIFNTTSSFGTAAKSLWKLNAGITSSDSVVQTGSMGMGVASYEAPATPKSTSGTLLSNKATTQGAPIFYYTVKAKTSKRTATTVSVTFSISASLKYSKSYFGRPYSLKGSVYVGGAWHSVTIKKASAFWRGKTAHTVNLTVKVTGLTKDTTSLTGIKFKVDRTDSTGGAVTGELPSTACKNLTISKYADDTPESYYLTTTAFGSGEKWHGASITRVLPADAAGHVGAVDGTLTWSQKMSIGSSKSSTSELGQCQVLCTTGTGGNRRIVAGCNIYKGTKGSKAKLRFYVNHATVETIEGIDLSHGNSTFGDTMTSSIVKLPNQPVTSTVGAGCSITKSGDTIIFDVAGIKRTFKNSAIAETPINEVTFILTSWGTRTKLRYNGIYSIKFVKNNCETIKDIPNKFSAGDVVEADCKDGKIYLNGMLNQSLGALGNDWEDFYLKKGLNQIGFAFSEWTPTEYAPEFKIKYREVFL